MECQICFSEYNSNDHRPKSLPCGHSLCESCVKDNLEARDGIMKCPFCRAACGTGVQTSDDFPTTFALLNLLDTGEYKSASNALSPEEKENKIFERKKQTKSDDMEAHILDCNENLKMLLHAKETQESAIQSIKAGKKKLLEDYQWEENKRDEAEKMAISMKDQLDDTVAEGNDILKGLEALKDCIQSSSNLSDLDLATQDLQRYNAVSQEWVTNKVKIFLIDRSFKNEVVECRRTFAARELYYSCLQCRTGPGSALCGSCFINSAHVNHQYEIRQSSGQGGFCDCGRSDVWRSDPVCFKHSRKYNPPLQAHDVEAQSLAKCKEVLLAEEKYYSCLDCRTRRGVIMCGTCFINSSHIGHRYEISTYRTDGSFCDCGRREEWTNEETCRIHH